MHSRAPWSYAYDSMYSLHSHPAYTGNVQVMYPYIECSTIQTMYSYITFFERLLSKLLCATEKPKL